MRQFFSLCSLFLSLTLSTQAQTVQSPEQFLGYPLGAQYTHYHQVNDYFQYVSEHPQNVKWQQYGETYEHRPLHVAIISAPENMAKLESLRKDNLKRAGVLAGSPQDDVPIVWLSYNIHGNEASSTEAAMKTMYALVNPQNQEMQEALKKVVVIIDPCMNPDGRERYVHFYEQYGATTTTPNNDDIEHSEPWPGGRYNHYLFDMNRDWVWQTQQESRERVAIYHQWMPEIHVDFHEQGISQHYYFAPAAEPFHEVITPAQRDLQTAIGKGHAARFDKQGWLYFTRQEFDLLYPSYGDTYPTYNGSIGMTYEQAGNGASGISSLMDNGDTLTLADRVQHHYTTGISTIAFAATHAAQMDAAFAQYNRQNAESGVGKYKTYIVSASNDPDAWEDLRKLLDQNQIIYGHPFDGELTSGFAYQDQQNESFTLKKDDWLISTYQAKGRLVKALFEPKTKLSDSVTYDITAWALPYAYGLKAWASQKNFLVDTTHNKRDYPSHEVLQSMPYAIALKYYSFTDARLLAALQQKDIKIRVLTDEATFDGEKWCRGSLFITRFDNQWNKNWYTQVAQMADSLHQPVKILQSGWSDNGVDLGSGDLDILPKPKVAMLAGEGTSPLQFGEVWNFFEQQLGYPAARIRVKDLRWVNLHDYTTLIMPSGYYQQLEPKQMEQLSDWVSKGGRLIAMGDAIEALAKNESLKLAHEYQKTDQSSEQTAGEQDVFGQQQRESISNEIFGAIYAVQLDDTHPLAYGYGDTYFSLKTSSSHYALMPSGWNVGVLPENVKPVSGFAGYYANQQQSNSLVFGTKDLGRGQVVYLVDNPLFRGFWESGKLLFSNAVFMTGF